MNVRLVMDRGLGALGVAILGLWGATMFAYHQRMESWPLPALAIIATTYLGMVVASFHLLTYRAVDE